MPSEVVVRGQQMERANEGLDRLHIVQLVIASLYPAKKKKPGYEATT